MKLCRMCAEIDNCFNTILKPCSNLMPLGVNVRYPSSIERLEEDMQMALKDAMVIYEQVYSKIEIILKPIELERPPFEMKMQ